MGITVGIDLGTSTSEISYIEGGKPCIIKNEFDEKITPSIVSIGAEGQFIVGKEAKERATLYPEDTVMEVKRMVGTDKTIVIKGRKYSPEQISAEILKHLKQYGEKQLGQPIEKAVITVPAYFTEQQRKATVKAGMLAGIDVERVINEPTAAALTYGIEHMSSEQHILVYDLGGGTFDVSLLEMFDGVLEVKASSGNNELGGKDFDQRIIEYVIKEFQRKNGINLSGDIGAMIKIKDEVEKCKIALSENQSYRITIPFIGQKDGNPIEVDEELTRDKFEDLIEDLIQLTRKPIDVVLQDSNVKKEEIDLILLVGGSTRIPKIKNFVENLLGQKPRQLVDPDLAVAQGAAIQAGILEGVFNQEDGILITDVSPYALGIEVVTNAFGFVQADIMDILIERNTTIPVTEEKVYVTFSDNQERVDITVYQGEDKVASNNNLIGCFSLQGIPPREAGKENIKVKFSYNANGMLEVEGIILSTGEKAEIQINMLEVKKEDLIEKIDITQWVEAPKAKEYRLIIRKAERMLKKYDEDNKYAIELSGLINEIKIAIIEDDEEEILEIEEDIIGLLERIK